MTGSNCLSGMVIFTMARAIRGPVDDLPLDVHHFRRRVAKAHNERMAHAAMAVRCWRFDPAKR
jgi:hypothetical protein